jgi:hypothetical protein
MTTDTTYFTMSPAEAPEYYYTKQEVDALVADAVAQAHEADRILMAKHNRTATIISMILGLICLALFVDGLLRILGIIPPFMDLDVSILDEVVERVENDVMPLVQQAKGYIPRI